MAYSDFTLKTVKAEFQLRFVENTALFADIQPIELSPFLSELLQQNVPLALAMGTEKASSELIIINVLLEIKRRLNISFFSGIDFTVDKEKGLNGFCDFIISQSAEQLFLEAPLIAVVEAKNERIMAGAGQCVAEMIAARLYNQREGKNISVIYGAVTTGHAWKFFKLDGNTVYIDQEDYYIKNAEKIIGIFCSMIEVGFVTSI